VYSGHKNDSLGHINLNWIVKLGCSFFVSSLRSCLKHVVIDLFLILPPCTVVKETQ
jgi:hypothetical protein